MIIDLTQLEREKLATLTDDKIISGIGSYLMEYSEAEPNSLELRTARAYYDLYVEEAKRRMASSYYEIFYKYWTKEIHSTTEYYCENKYIEADYIKGMSKEEYNQMVHECIWKIETNGDLMNQIDSIAKDVIGEWLDENTSIRQG